MNDKDARGIRDNSLSYQSDSADARTAATANNPSRLVGKQQNPTQDRLVELDEERTRWG